MSGNPRALRYDADKQMLVVSLNGDSATRGASVKQSTLSPVTQPSERFVRFVLRRGPVSTEQFAAQNSFGATTKVTRSTWEETGVALLDVRSSIYSELSITIDAPPTVSIAMAPERARQLFERAEWVVRFQSAAWDDQSYPIIDDGWGTKATIESPREVTIYGKTLTAKLISAELRDRVTGESIATLSR